MFQYCRENTDAEICSRIVGKTDAEICSKDCRKKQMQKYVAKIVGKNQMQKYVAKVSKKTSFRTI
jgi:hypothetical protein